MSGVNFNPNPGIPRNIGSQSQVNSNTPVANDGGGSGGNVSTGNQGAPMPTETHLANPVFAKVLNLNALEANEFARLVRDLMSMPKEFKFLLQQLLELSGDPKKLAQFLKDGNADINLNDLQKLLQGNGKQVITKLITLMQASRGMVEQQGQFKELLGFVSETVAKAQQSPQEAMHSTLLLYLPWLPLAEPQQFDLRYGFSAEDDEQQASSEGIEVLVMYVSTINIGSFHVTVMVNKERKVEIDLLNDALTMEELAQIKEKILEKLTISGVEPQIQVGKKEPIIVKENADLEKAGEKMLSLHPSGKISSLTLTTGYTVAKTIFELDQKMDLFKNRKQKIK